MKEDSGMNVPELAACVALIADDAEHRFGFEANLALRDAYSREAVLEFWLTQPGVTVATARRMLCQVHNELQRRWDLRREQQEERQLAIDALLTEPGLPSARCQSHRSTQHLPRMSNPGTPSLQSEAEGMELVGKADGTASSHVLT